jgi:hypothetical protein
MPWHVITKDLAMRLLTILTPLLLAFCGMPWHATAGERQQWEVVSDGIDGVLVSEAIGEVVGDPGEDRLAVLHRAGEQLVAYSQETRFEGCAEICTAGSGSELRFGLTLTSVKSHLGCPVLPVCPKGFSPGGGNIHSHGSSRPYRINKSDSALSSYEVGEVQKEPHNQHKFSGEDLRANKDGAWLARPDGLLFASGKGKGLEFIPTPTTGLANQAP